MISTRFALATAFLVVSIGVVAVPSVASAATAPAHAASVSVPNAAAKPKSFANCTDLHKTYKAGVAKAGTKWNVIHPAHGKAYNKKITGSPKFDTALYNANKSLDRDKDGIACELD
ncbi:MAG: hypothetical protein JWP75_36 [Frondihabitans sp.]|nr:hypothetical protein [Frondihabitans sp.]